jgi:hypothetical protein
MFKLLIKTFGLYTYKNTIRKRVTEKERDYVINNIFLISCRSPRQPAVDNGGLGMHHRSPASGSLASGHFFEMSSHLLRKCDPNPRWIWAGVVCLTATNLVPPPYAPCRYTPLFLALCACATNKRTSWVENIN